MEKNEAFRKQVVSHLYGLPEPSDSEPVKEEAKPIATADDDSNKDTTTDKKPCDENQTPDKPVVKDDEEAKIKSENDDNSQEKSDNIDTATDAGSGTEIEKANTEDETKTEEKMDTSNNSENVDISAVAVVGSVDLSVAKSEVKPLKVSVDGVKSKTPALTEALNSSNNSNKSTTTITTPTTTTSHLYSVLMAPLDGHSPYKDNILRYGNDDSDTGPRKRMRLDNLSGEKTKVEPAVIAPTAVAATEGGRDGTNNSKVNADTNTNTEANNSSVVGMDLSKTHKKKLKKKRRKHLLNKLEIQRAKDFIYSSENEQYSVEKLRTMIEDVTEFLDAIWDVYCSEARLKGESVEDERFRVVGVLKCLNSSGESSWGDLQLLSRAKSVLVLRSKHLAASTIARVENELGYDSDTRTFIVRMLKFWMGEVVTKG